MALQPMDQTALLSTEWLSDVPGQQSQPPYSQEACPCGCAQAAEGRAPPGLQLHQGRLAAPALTTELCHLPLMLLHTAAALCETLLGLAC